MMNTKIQKRAPLLSLLCTALGSVILLSSCSSTHDPSSIKYSYARKPNPYYTVREGETVESIAAKFSMPVDDLIQLNRLSAPYELIQGQKLIVYPKQKTNNFESDGVEVSNNDSQVGPGITVNPKIASDAAHPESLTNINDSHSDGVDHSDSTPDVSAKGKGLYHWPVKGKVTNKMKVDTNGKLTGGINISAPEGTPVYAAAKGVVAKSDVTVQGYGKTIIIKHHDGTMSVYSHLKSCTAKEGQPVDPQTIIGRVGKSGGLKKPELHFQIRDQQKKYLDPLKVLRD